MERAKPAETVLELFAVTPPGLEKVTAGELSFLGLSPHMEAGGVTFRGGLRELYLANLWLRTASRVLLKVAEFRAVSFKELVSRVARYPWEIYLSRAEKVRIRATCRKSRLYHSGAVAERVVKGISARLSRELELTKDEEAPLIVVRLFRDRVLLRIDTSGRDLFKRGYKVAPGPAPLRENLAAALVLLSGWDHRAPFLDPFCGTGTIVIEAAMMAADLAPGLHRSFFFEEWRNFDPSLWEELRAEARTRVHPPEALILGSDISVQAVEAARENARAARVDGFVRFEICDVRDLHPPAPFGYLVTNPPYGERLSKTAYHLLAKVVRERFKDWVVVFLSPDKEPLKGVPLWRVAVFQHGGLDVNVFRGRGQELFRKVRW